MADKSKIEWTDATWNPVTGCSKISAGCKNCYAETFAERWRDIPGHHFQNGFDVTMRPEMLRIPLQWTRPRRVFVNSMSDLFHEDVSFAFIREVFGIMAVAKRHTFQILTKRPARMLEWFKWVREYGLLAPLANVWVGVSVENQDAADVRIPLLLQAPAAVRFLSCEPLLGPVDLTSIDRTSGSDPGYNALRCGPDDEGPLQTIVDWVICGGESGPGARPMHPDWARSLRDQCLAVGAPFFFKQWGEWIPNEEFSFPLWYTKEFLWLYPDGHTGEHGGHQGSGSKLMQRVGKRVAGRLLDGREWNEFPEVSA